MAERLTFDFSLRLIETAKRHADFVVIDSPPLTAVIDALPLAKYVDSAIIVSRLGVTRVSQLGELYAMLCNYGTVPSGFVVIGGTAIRRSPYYSGRFEGLDADPSRVAPPINLRPASDP